MPNGFGLLIALCCAFSVGGGPPPQDSSASASSLTLNRPADGYRGIWYSNQPSKDEYVYKYSGGLGTYCAKHSPHAVYRADVGRTYFTWGGAPRENSRRLLHMVSYYDHATGRVPRPTILLDKRTGDAHDNPVISMDEEGHVWIFSTSHGRARPSYIHRSVRPHDVREFEQVLATFVSEDGTTQSLDNFSYFQVWRQDGHFLAFFTHYGNPAKRTSFFVRSKDGIHWSRWQRLAAIEEGHYQISAATTGKAACAFNFHPEGQGLNWRTNLYYLQTPDLGKTWTAADGTPVDLPVVKAATPALVWDARSEGLKVYLKDLCFDDAGHPWILTIASRGYEAGPDNGPRRWLLHRWNGATWSRTEITSSDNNYDMGSLWRGQDDWWLFAPTRPGPQTFNPGGEMAAWRSGDGGGSWALHREMTAASPYNHTYARRPVDAHPDFVAFWADGHGRRPSESRLYFADHAGRVFRLPTTMEGEWAEPDEVQPGDD